jgi:hypothetical protein
MTRLFLWKVTYWNLTQGHRTKGIMRKASSIICFPDPELWKVHLEY